MSIASAFKRYPTPVFKPLWPFFVAGGVVLYFVGKGAEASMNSDEFINDPRHPRFKAAGKHEKH